MNVAWTSRAYSFFDTLWWIACLNLLWIFFTLAGMVIFGAGPSTVAAHELLRRRLQGDVVPLARAFSASYGRNFLRGNAFGLPLLFVGFMLAGNWGYFASEATFASQFISVVIALLGVIFTAAVCVLFPMHARYDLPLGRYFLQSPRFALHNLAGSVLLLLVTAAVGYASLKLPGLIPFLSIGLWIYTTGWLCGKLFEANDRVVSGAPVSGGTDVAAENVQRPKRSRAGLGAQGSVAHHG